MSLPWSSQLEIGILELDEQQQELFTKFEFFSELVEKEHHQLEIKPFIDYLDHYTREHFSYEEQLQERAHFPERAAHLAAHRGFIEELKGFKAALRSGQQDSQEIALALKGLMIRWIITHIKHSDLAFNRFLVAASEAAQKELASMKLGEILVESQLVSAATLERALTRQRQTGDQLGSVMVEMGIISNEQIKEALLAQEGKSLFTEKIGHILVESGLISYQTLDNALESQKSSGKLVGAVLVEMGVVDLQDVVCAQAVQKGMLPREVAGE